MSSRNGIVVVTFGSQRRGVGARPGPTRRVQRVDLAVDVDEGEQVATHPAQMRTGDGDGRVRGDCGVDGVAAAANISTPAVVARWSAEATRWFGARTERSGGLATDMDPTVARQARSQIERPAAFQYSSFRIRL